ncbi:hypothetical protein AKO1_004588, partial [Acrasis kona]
MIVNNSEIRFPSTFRLPFTEKSILTNLRYNMSECIYTSVDLIIDEHPNQPIATEFTFLKKRQGIIQMYMRTLKKDSIVNVHHMYVALFGGDESELRMIDIGSQMSEIKYGGQISFSCRYVADDRYFKLITMEINWQTRKMIGDSFSNRDYRTISCNLAECYIYGLLECRIDAKSTNKRKFMLPPNRTSIPQGGCQYLINLIPMNTKNMKLFSKYELISVSQYSLDIYTLEEHFEGCYRIQDENKSGKVIIDQCYLTKRCRLEIDGREQEVTWSDKLEISINKNHFVDVEIVASGHKQGGNKVFALIATSAIMNKLNI